MEHGLSGQPAAGSRQLKVLGSKLKIVFFLKERANFSLGPPFVKGGRGGFLRVN